MVVSTNRRPLPSQTLYQLQPDSDHLNDTALPAVALSNFFRPPAVKISGSESKEKLPVVKGPIQSKREPTHSVPSLHKNTRCLVEVIQSQLLELKKIQGRYSRTRPEKRLSLSLDMSQPTTPTTTLNAIVPTKTNPPYRLSPPTSPATSRYNHTTLPSIQTSHPITNHSKLEKIPTKTSLNSIKQTIKQTAQPNKVSPDKSLATIHIGAAFLKSNMDPRRLASVHRWVQNVDRVHKTEGKFVIPALEHHHYNDV